MFTRDVGDGHFCVAIAVLSSERQRAVGVRHEALCVPTRQEFAVVCPRECRNGVGVNAVDVFDVFERQSVPDREDALTRGSNQTMALWCELCNVMEFG